MSALDEIEARLAALEAAPRLMLAYRASVSALDRCGHYSPRDAGIWRTAERAEREATALAERIRRQSPGDASACHVVPVIVVTLDGKSGSIISFSDSVEISD